MKFVVVRIFKSLMLISIAAFLSACPKPCENISAGFSASATRGQAPLEIAFNDESTGEIKGWEWNFGDGNTSQTRNPVHRYEAPGTYTVSLTVFCEDGATDNETKNNLIIVDPSDLNADFSAVLRNGVAPATIRFTDLSVGNIGWWEWDFGDGTFSNQPNPDHAYEKGGLYTVSLTVRKSRNSEIKDTETKKDFIGIDEVRPITPANVGPYFPRQIEGDCEFDGNGPRVEMAAGIQMEPGGQAILLKLSMYARETKPDYSTARGNWEHRIPVHLPSGWVIKDIVSNPSASHDEIDLDIPYDFEKYELGKFRWLGDTEGDDICNETEDDTHMYFEDIRFLLRVGPNFPNPAIVTKGE